MHSFAERGPRPIQPYQTFRLLERLVASTARALAHSELSVEEPYDAQGVYIISVAARILEMHPQTLRKYERIGLVSPFRTEGSLRLYSEEDIARLRLIKHLVGDLGLNLAGVQLVLGLFNQMLNLRAHLGPSEREALEEHVSHTLEEMFRLMGFGTGSAYDDDIAGVPRHDR